MNYQQSVSDIAFKVGNCRSEEADLFALRQLAAHIKFFMFLLTLNVSKFYCLLVANVEKQIFEILLIINNRDGIISLRRFKSDFRLVKHKIFLFGAKEKRSRGKARRFRHENENHFAANEEKIKYVEINAWTAALNVKHRSYGTATSVN